VETSTVKASTASVKTSASTTVKTASASTVKSSATTVTTTLGKSGFRRASQRDRHGYYQKNS
jgi:hypothetical protein